MTKFIPSFIHRSNATVGLDFSLDCLSAIQIPRYAAGKTTAIFIHLVALLQFPSLHALFSLYISVQPSVSSQVLRISFAPAVPPLPLRALANYRLPRHTRRSLVQEWLSCLSIR
jgi:hypothetical protein